MGVRVSVRPAGGSKQCEFPRVAELALFSSRVGGHGGGFAVSWHSTSLLTGPPAGKGPAASWTPLGAELWRIRCVCAALSVLIPPRCFSVGSIHLLVYSWRNRDRTAKLESQMRIEVCYLSHGWSVCSRKALMTACLVAAISALSSCWGQPWLALL